MKLFVWLREFFLQNLTKWGGALLELSQFQNVGDSKRMINGTQNFLLQLKQTIVV